MLNKGDQGHLAARAIGRTLGRATLITTQEVLTEVLTYFCEDGPYIRRTVAAFVHGILDDRDIMVYPQTDQSFLSGLALYEARPDKGYSLTDCVSMNTMRDHGISEVLTNDDHFTREGFIRLL